MNKLFIQGLANIFIVWLVMFLFCWALVHGAKRQRESLDIYKED